MDSKPGHDPESAQRWKNGRSVLAENVKAVLPLFWQFHGFPLLLMVVGWWCFFFFGWLVGFCFFVFFSAFHSYSQLSQGNTPEALSCQGPLTTAVHSDGAAQASPWCSPSAPTLSILLSECGSTEATPRGRAGHSSPPKAEGERVPFLPNAGAQLKASAPLHK